MTERALFTPNRLFCPGPTPSPWATKSASLNGDIYHRSKEFELLVSDCSRMLKPLFGTTEQPIILTSSGTGAMEAVVVNITDPGDVVVVVVAGKFGERWQKINSAYGNQVISIQVEYGRVPTNEQIQSVFQDHPRPKAFFFQANETSTGARLDVKGIAALVRGVSPETLIVVDAISSLGAHHLDMDANGIDAATGGSQKGFGVAPGLSFVALSSRARAGKSKRAKFYFDLEREQKGQIDGRTAWTPAVNLVQSLHVALMDISQIGADKFIEHHARLGRACRAAIATMGLQLFVEEKAISNALTAISVPKNIEGLKVLSIAKSKYGAIISGGQDSLKGKIIRFSHLGFVSQFMLLEGLAALEFSLADCGLNFDLGQGVASAMKDLRLET